MIYKAQIENLFYLSFMDRCTLNFNPGMDRNIHFSKCIVFVKFSKQKFFKLPSTDCQFNDHKIYVRCYVSYFEIYISFSLFTHLDFVRDASAR